MNGKTQIVVLFVSTNKPFVAFKIITNRKGHIMPNMLVKHTVEDFAKWYPVYTEHAAMRKAAGSKGARLFRNSNNPNEIVLLFEWDSLDNARTFSQSQELRETMHNAGVVGMPDMYFLEETEHTAF
jgi:heme-degrading monooxygenase HmoA